MDDEQERAVNYQGSAIIIAAPGSGKTHTLIERAKLAPENSIALTFTRSAAGELKQRAPGIEASTIHSFCYKHIRKFPGDYDLLLHEFLSMKTKPKYDMVLIDEAMDLSLLELKVVKSIIGKDVFIVLDPYQSIFLYANALGGNILKYFEGITKFHLNRNYRSKHNIVRQLEAIHLRNLISIGSKELEGTFVLFRTNNQLNNVAYGLSQMDFHYNIRRKKGSFPGAVVEDSNGTNLTLMTIHCSKGLEAKKVILFDWGERNYEHNLLYVAVARASDEFHLINSLSGLVSFLGKEYRTPKKEKKKNAKLKVSTN